MASASANYGSHYGDTRDERGRGESGGPDSISTESAEIQGRRNAEFSDVWQQEFGFSFETMKAVWNGFCEILEADRKSVFKCSRSALIARLAAETDLSHEIIHSCLNPFTYSPREKWNSAPSGMGDWAWSPWKFQRPLSIVTRPIIQFDGLDDPTLVIAPAMITSHLNKLIVGARTGDLERRLFRDNGPMFRWIDKISAETGESFNEKVASRFREIGWEARANLSDGEILNRRRTQGFGDVDVLAWNRATGRILIVECKDLSMDKTIGEIARRLEKYKGEIKDKGRKDDLRKHLDRCVIIEAERSRVEAFVEMQINNIDRVLLFSEPTPLKYSSIKDHHKVAVITYAEIADFLEGGG